MKSSVDASIEFYFKGEKYTPSAIIDLDSLLESQGGFPVIYSILARENNIDPYSYEYEVLISSDIHFANARGLADAFVHNGELDLAAFETAWQAARINNSLLALAKEHMNIDKLDDIAGLKTSLLAAYELGKNVAQK